MPRSVSALSNGQLIPGSHRAVGPTTRQPRRAGCGFPNAHALPLVHPAVGRLPPIGQAAWWPNETGPDVRAANAAGHQRVNVAGRVSDRPWTLETWHRSDGGARS